MPLDPNIILSGLQQQRGVDMNALLQQKISGMENINALERQRKSDELVMQDRAAKQAKEQEAAAIKALLPAYTYGIQTGDIAGAGNLAPPEMRGQLQPFIDALTGKSPQEVQAALIGSLASSGEVGQEALAAIQRAQTYGVQARQAKTAEDRLALDAERQAAELAAGNKVASREVDAQGNVHFFDAYGNELRVAPGAGKPLVSAQTSTTPEGMNPKTKAKFDEAYPKSVSALRTTVTGINNALFALEQLINDPGLELISGTVGAYTPNINADAKRAQSLFDQVKAGAGLAALVELKQSSPAGGALGNVSNQEGNTLRESRGAFLQTQEYEDLRKALIDYYMVLERSKANVIGAFNDTYNYRGENAAEDILQSAQQQAEDIETQTQQKFPSISNQPSVTSIRRVK